MSYYNGNIRVMSHKTPRGQNYDNALFCAKMFRQNKFDRDSFGLKVSEQIDRTDPRNSLPAA